MRKRAARVLAYVVVVAAAAAALPLVESPPAQAATQTFTLSLVQGQLLLRGAEQPFPLQAPTSLSGSVETDTGVISGGSLSTPTISFTQDITDPLPATVFIDATFSEVSPGTASGSIDSDGNMVVQDSLTVDLHIEVGSPAFLTADCRATPVNLTLASTSPYNSNTNRVTLTDPNFSVPAVPTVGTCSSLVAPVINEQLSGSGHSLTMTLDGAIELPPPPSAPSTTKLTVDPPNGSRLGDNVTMTATVEPVESSTDVPNGFVDFRDGEAVLATVPVTGGIATFATSSLAAGGHTLSARYRGDPVFAPSTSAAVPYLVAATPVVTSTLPETIQIGGGPAEFHVMVSNPAEGSAVANARVDVTIARALGTGAFTPAHVALERFDGSQWQPVTLLSPTGTPVRTMFGSIGTATGVALPAGASLDETLRLAFGPPGGSTPLPGPVSVTFEVLKVDPSSGLPAPTFAAASSELASTERAVTMTEEQRRTSTVSFSALLGPPISPPVARQGYTIRVSNGTINPAVSGVRPTGTVEFYFDDENEPRGSSAVLPSGAFVIDLVVPLDLPVGQHEITVKYLGDLLFLPSEATRTLEVLTAPAGTFVACTRVSPTATHTFTASLEAHAQLPVARTAGSEATVADLQLTLFTDRGALTVSDLVNSMGTGVTLVGTGTLDAVKFGFGPRGTGTATATERTGTVMTTPDRDNPDQIVDFQGASGSVSIDGAPGDVVPVTVDSVSVEAHDLLGLPWNITCEPLSSAARVGEITVAGTTLTVDPVGPVLEGTEVTLDAKTFPANAAGKVQFFSGTDPIGDPVDVDDGAASLTTSTLAPGTHELTAHFNADDPEVPDTTSDPTTLVVEALEAPVATSPPTLTGDPLVGSTLTFQPGVWGGNPPPDVSWQWLLCTDPADRSTCEAVAADTQLALTAEHVGRHVVVAVTGVNQVSTTEVMTNAIGPVTAPTPTVTLDLTSVVAGGSFTVTGAGFESGGDASFTLLSDPVGLGGALVGGDGVFSATVTVPADTEPGMHTLRVAGTDVAGGPVSVDAALEVLAAEQPGGSEQPGGPGGPGAAEREGGSGSASAANRRLSNGGRLPFTGAAGLLTLLAVGLALTTIGAVAYRSRRRTALGSTVLNEGEQ